MTLSDLEWLSKIFDDEASRGLFATAALLVNSFSIYGVDEATLFKFGKWVEYRRVHLRGEKFPLKGAWPGSRDVTFLKILNHPFNIFGMDEATVFKFGKCVDYGKSHTMGKNCPRNGCGLCHVTAL